MAGTDTAAEAPGEAAERARSFTRTTTVFDCLGLFYVLDEPYATRCLEAGVDICNVSFALESSWDQTMSAVDEGFARIEASPVLALARDRRGDRRRPSRPAGSRWSPARKAPA